ncbi:MAG TPA: hypothetical protein VIK27_09930 [Candidatus Aquilonibacter sp.]
MFASLFLTARSFFPPFLPAAAAGDRLGGTPTRASDSIDAPMRGMKWFQSSAGGAGAGTYAVYDTSTSVYATCGYEDTAHESQYWHVPPGDIPRQIPRRVLGIDLDTARGIRFGDTIGDVEAMYGYTKPSRVSASLWALAYTKTGPPAGNLHFVTETTFYFRGGRLVGVDRVAGI